MCMRYYILGKYLCIGSYVYAFFFSSVSTYALVLMCMLYYISGKYLCIGSYVYALLYLG